jgi:hypothetical protein
MRRGVLSAMPCVVVRSLAKVTTVMEQGGNYADDEEFARERRFRITPGALIPIHQPRHRQRDFEHVLQIVVAGIARKIPRVPAAVQAAGIEKGALELIGACAAKKRLKDAKHLGGDLIGISRLHRSSDILIVSPQLPPVVAHRCPLVRQHNQSSAYFGREQQPRRFPSRLASPAKRALKDLS